MAKFDFVYPKEILDDLKHVYVNSDYIFGEMTRAGAELAYSNVLENMKDAFEHPEKLSPYLRITRVYHTYTDGGINCKVAFYGYYPTKNGKPYINRRNVSATEAFEYKTGRKHGATRIGGRRQASYEYKQKGVPVPLIVMAREYGTSSGEKKISFFRKSFKASAIERAMLKRQKEVSGGLLE